VTRCRRLPLLLAVTGTAALVVGCGSGSSKPKVGSKSDAKTGSTVAAKKPTATSAQGPNAVKVRLTAGGFAPSAVSAKTGQIIVWTNTDKAKHAIAATAGATFRSRTLVRGGTYTFSVSTPGTIRYRDPLHKRIKGTITVRK
jgi:plastocyanin